MKKDNQIVCAIAVIFDTEGRIVVIKRHDPSAPHFHDKWGLPAGLVDFGEHPAETARRESKEEVGLDIEITHPYPIVRSMIDEDRGYQVILLAFPAKVVGGVIDFESDPGTSDAKWLTYDEVDFANGLPFMQELIDEAKKLHKEATA
jgi:8-oxo-dGTP diphosphatase